MEEVTIRRQQGQPATRGFLPLIAAVPGERPETKRRYLRGGSIPGGFRLVVVVRVSVQGAEELQDPRLLPVGDELLQGKGHRGDLGFLSADLDSSF